MSAKRILFVIHILLNTSLPYCLCSSSEANRIDLKDDYSSSHVYTFAESNSFISLPTNPLWNIIDQREVVFQFRSDRPHGLLMYHTVQNATPGLPIYELYVALENGRIKVIHEFGAEQKSFFMGKGLNHDIYHDIKVHIDPTSGKLVAHLDHEHRMAVTLTSMAKFFSENNLTDIESVLYFGGTHADKPIAHQQYSLKRFVGCLGKIKFQVTRNSSKHIPKAFVTLKEFAGVQKNCMNLCKKLDLCAHSAACVNHYTYKSCDCFATEHEDWLCRSNNLTKLTLRGYSFVSYKIYKYKNKVYSDFNRISLHFKTLMRDGILVYANGEQPLYNYLAVNLHDGILYFEINLGDGPINASISHITLTDNRWHNLTIRHYSSEINLIVDDDVTNLQLPGHNHHLHVDPDIFFGGLPIARYKSNISKLGIPFDVNQKFVGCLKSIYFNRINILYEMHNNNKAAHYHSIFAPQYGCSHIDPVPITMSTKSSHFIVNIVESQTLQLSLEFNSEDRDVIIASGNLMLSDNSNGFWFLYLNDSIARFSIRNTNNTLMWNISNNLKYLANYWQHISIIIDEKGLLTIVSNYKNKKTHSFNNYISNFYGNVSIGAPLSTNISFLSGLKGCLRDISLNHVSLNPLTIFKNYIVIGKLSLDNCQLVNPCNSPKACEHGGKCSFENEQIKCDCNNTGYIGKTCHFSKFKRSCEELYLAGHTRSGTYMIDIDGNGPLPPAHIICIMSKGDGMIQTIVEHNIRDQLVVRKKGEEGDFYINVTYRDFTPEMLHSLISHSKQCSQYIKYECNLAPLRLASYTWMQSAEAGHKVTSIENDIPGRCKCSTAQNCFDRSKYCNCDSEAIGWRHDDGVLTNAKDIGITRMFFLQPKNLTKDSEAHLILGNVSCFDSNTREYDITFKTKESYLEVSGWEGGDMAVSFRTTATKAVLFYQSSLHSRHGYFKAILSSENEITFEFSVNGSPRSVKLISSRRLNTGEWQQIWVESDAHHIMFTVNSNTELIDLEFEEQISTFEGPLYVGGAPKYLLENSEIRTGFIGCLRGLVLNNIVVNLYKYLHRGTANIASGCRPFCKPDLCQNGATCVELWGSYECKCANPISQSGRHCEININTNGMTFITPSSYFQKLKEGVEAKEVNPILEKDILISFRTQMSDALIFYANDYRNNFVQLTIENGTHVVFSYNSFDIVVRGAVNVGHVLTSGNPIQIKIDRSQRRKTILTANDVSIIIDYPIKFLTKYSQKPWKHGDEFELVKPARPPVPIEAHNQLFLGGVDGISATSKIQGIVGCLKGFVIDGKQFDMEAAANEPLTVTRGHIKPGCDMLCDQFPCLNGGVCIEHWKNNNFVCNCNMTSYGGPTCAKDVGAIFNGQSLVKYTFNLDNDKTNVDIKMNYISIHLAFSADLLRVGRASNIMFVTFAQSSSYLYLAITADGDILLEENDGISNIKTKVIISDEQSFADQHRHWLLYNRTGEKAHLIVDSEVYEISANLGSKSPHSEEINENNLILVGGIDSFERFANTSNFIGCISNVFVELNDIRIEPLESAFGGKSDLNQVKVIGDIKQGLCAPFKLHVPLIPPSREKLPEVEENEWLTPPPPVLTLYRMNILLPKSKGRINQLIVFIICVTFLFVVLLSVGLYMWRLQKTYKMRQFQGDTPFFHAKRNTSIRNREGKYHMIPSGKDDNETAVILLQHQELPVNGPQESHPMKESINFDESVKSSLLKFKEPVNEYSLIKPINGNNDCDPNQVVNALDSRLETGVKQTNINDTLHSTYRELEWNPNEECTELINVDMNRKESVISR